MKKNRSCMVRVGCVAVLIVLLSGFQSIKAGRIMVFDMGGKETPVWKGSIPVYKDSVYSPARGFGWIWTKPKEHGNLSTFRTLRLVRGYATPDNLVGDFVFWRGGEDPLLFRIDIPDGEYEVCLWTRIWTGTWFCNRGDFSITVDGKPKVQVRQGRDDLIRKLFYEADNSFEWKPGDDIWNKYVKLQSGPFYRFKAVAKDGRLELAFHMPFNGGFPHAQRGNNVATNVIPISAIIVSPADSARKLDKELAKIEVERKKQFDKQCVIQLADVQKTPKNVPKKYRTLGFVPFVRHPDREIYHNEYPADGEIEKDLDIRVARGERGIARFSIMPMRDLKDVKIELSPLKSSKGKELPMSTLNWHWMRYIERPLHFSRKVLDYRPMPDLMMPPSACKAQKGVNRQFAVAFTAADDTPPGEYTGKVTIRSANAPSFSFNLKVKVYPFELETYPDDDERIWIDMASNLYKKYGDMFLSKEEQLKWIDRDFAFMKRYHIAPTILFSWFAPMEELDRIMSLYVKHGFRGYPLYGGYELLNMIDGFYRGRSGPIDYKPFIDIIKKVSKRQKQRGWPEFVFYFSAEIHTGMQAYLSAKDGIAQIKKACPNAKLVVLPNMLEELEVLVDSQADIIGPNAVSMTQESVAAIQKAGKKIWFYGWGRERFRCGLVDWRCGSRGGVNEWYSATGQASFNPFDAGHHDSWNDAPPLIGPDGPIPSLNLERTTAGRIDFLYLATLEQWIERCPKASQNTPAFKSAVKLIEDLKNKIRPDYNYYWKRKRSLVKNGSSVDISRKRVFGWKAEDYDALRIRIAERICELKKLCN